MGETYYLTANAQPRPNDQPTQAETQFRIKSIKLEWSWGNRPAEAMITFTGAGVLYVGAELAIGLAGHAFYGIANDPVSTISTKANQPVVRFADRRGSASGARSSSGSTKRCAVAGFGVGVNCWGISSPLTSSLAPSSAPPPA